MNIVLLAVGNKMPDWVNKGYNEYAKRLNGDCRLKLVEIAPGKRGTQNTWISRDDGTGCVQVGRNCVLCGPFHSRHRCLPHRDELFPS